MHNFTTVWSESVSWSFQWAWTHQQNMCGSQMLSADLSFKPTAKAAVCAGKDTVTEPGTDVPRVACVNRGHRVSWWTSGQTQTHCPSGPLMTQSDRSQRGLVLKTERVHWAGQSRRKQTCLKPFLTNTLHPWSFLNSTWRCAKTQMSDSVFKLLAS